MSTDVAAVVLLAAFLHAGWNAWLRTSTDRLRVRTVMVLSSSLLCAGCLPFLPLPSPAAWPFLGLSVMFHLGYNLLLVRMYRQGDLGQTYVISRGVQPLLVSLGAAVLAKEMPSGSMLGGILLISVGIVALSGGDRLRARPAFAALLTGFAVTCSVLADGLGARVAGDPVVFATWVVALNGIPMIIFFVAARRDLRVWRMSRRDLVAALGGGTIATLGFGMIIWAMTRAPLGAVAALRETSVLFALLLGDRWLRESFSLRKVAAAATIVAGIVMVHLE